MELCFDDDDETLDQIGKEEMVLIRAMDNCDDIIYRKNIIKEMIGLTNARIVWHYKFTFRASLRMSIVMTCNEYGDNNSYIDYLTNSIDYEIGDTEKECILYGIGIYHRELIHCFKSFFDLIKSFNRYNGELYMKYIEGIDTDKIYKNRMNFYDEFLEKIVYDDESYLNDFDEFFQSLSDKDQTILNEKFGLNGGECQSMKDVALKLNVTREEIRRAVIRFKRKYMKKYH